MHHSSGKDQWDVDEKSKKSFGKKFNFQIVIFATIFMTLNGHTYELYKNIF